MDLIELFNYKASWLNPGLKWLAPAMFLIACSFIIAASANYGGVFKTALKYLAISVLVGMLAFLFRVAGDFILPGFKWGESLFQLAFVIVNVVVAMKFLSIIKEVKSDV